MKNMCYPQLYKCFPKERKKKRKGWHMKKNVQNLERKKKYYGDELYTRVCTSISKEKLIKKNNKRLVVLK